MERTCFSFVLRSHKLTLSCIKSQVQIFSGPQIQVADLNNVIIAATDGTAVGLGGGSGPPPTQGGSGSWAASCCSHCAPL